MGEGLRPTGGGFPVPEPKWTKGPWEWDECGHFCRLVDAEGYQILDDGSACGEYTADLCPRDPEFHLIAAAPELYEAFWHLVDKYCLVMDSEEVIAAYALCAKARGEGGE
jgi:hypothetical protein